MSNEDVLIDHDYVNVNSDDLNSIPSLCYQTISKGRGTFLSFVTV